MEKESTASTSNTLTIFFISDSLLFLAVKPRFAFLGSEGSALLYKINKVMDNPTDILVIQHF